MSSWLPVLADAARPRYLAIADAIGAGIEDGRLAPGERLPTQRALAYRLGVSVHTVSAAYALAERRGHVSGEVGRGTFVKPRRHPGADGPFFVDRRREDLIDLSINRPAVGHPHASRTRAAFADLAGATDLAAMLACRPIAGLDRHREAAAAWLARLGVEASPERVILTNGVVHGLLVALAALTRPGDLVVSEGLVDHGLIALAGVLHFHHEGLALDASGIVPEAFEAACRAGRVKVLCCTPTLNNPTAAVVPTERRRALAAIARAYGVAVVEDDVYGPLLPDSERPPPLHAFCPERAYYLTSFTKSVASGLRAGYLVAPAAAVPRLTTRLRATSWMATPLVAEIATRWLADGTVDELIAWQRAELGARNASLHRALAGFELAQHPRALHAWLTLPGGWRAESFAAQARLRGVAVTPAEPFVVGRLPQPHAVRLSLGPPASRAELERGLAALAEVLHDEPEPAFVAV